MFNFSCVQAYPPESLGQPVGENISGSHQKPAADKRQPTVPVAETPANTSHKEPPQVSFVKTTMDTLEGIREYASGNYGAEAKAVKEMEKLGYTTADIMACYQEKKKEPWWKEKSLTMMSVKSAIGEWAKHKGPELTDEQKGEQRREAEREMYRKDAEKIKARGLVKGR